MSAVENVVVIESKSTTKVGRGRKPTAKPDQADAKPTTKVGRSKKPKADVTESTVGGDKATVASNEKKPRKPSLPAKFGKFIQFGLFLLAELNDEKLVAGEDAAVDKEYMIEKLCVFADIDVQTAFVQKFFDGAKDTAKGMRKMIADKKKADVKAAKQDASAPKKERKPRAPKASVEQGADDQVEKKEQGTKKKSKKTDLVAELVTLANGQVQQSQAQPEHSQPEHSQTEQSQEKPKRKYNKKPKTNLTDAIPDAQTEPETELEVDLVTIDGKQFLKDDSGRLFDLHSHAPCGSLYPDGSINHNT
jgi:hypothetical protein